MKAIIDYDIFGEKNMEIGDAIKQARTKAGLSVQQLADKTGVCKASIYQIENGEQKRPSFETIHVIACNLTDGSIDELLNGGEVKVYKSCNWCDHKHVCEYCRKLRDLTFDATPSFCPVIPMDVFCAVANHCIRYKDEITNETN